METEGCYGDVIQHDKNTTVFNVTACYKLEHRCMHQEYGTFYTGTALYMEKLQEKNSFQIYQSRNLAQEYNFILFILIYLILYI
jgi:hypothetical protein